MTEQVVFLLAVVAAMAVLFFTEWLPIELTAVLGLLVLLFCGLLTPDQAFSGFASPTVITMVAVFVLGAALQHTGVADSVGAGFHRWLGGRESLLVLGVMAAAIALSAFMNNIAATAVLMPAVASLGRRTGLSPSRLFMPLSFATLLGGTLTLVGTPPNMLASDALRAAGGAGFSLFEFTPVGAALCALGVLYMLVVGRRLLPVSQLGPGRARDNLAEVYRLQEKLFSIRIPKGSRLDGASIEDAAMGARLGAQVLAIIRAGKRQPAPSAHTILHGGDELVVEGDIAELRKLLRVRDLALEEPNTADLRAPVGIGGVRARVRAPSRLAGKTLRQVALRDQYGVLVFAVLRDGHAFHDHLADLTLAAGDELLGLGTEPDVARFVTSGEVDASEIGQEALGRLREQPLFVLRIPQSSPLAGASVAQSRVGELMGLVVLAIVRAGEAPRPALPDEVLRAHDRLLVAGEAAKVMGLIALGDLALAEGADPALLESDEIGILEAALAPRSSLDGRTLAELRFSERYGLRVLGVWRAGAPIREGLATLPLRLGDALLLHGARPKLSLLAQDRDFVALSEVPVVRLRRARAPFAVLALLLMIGLVVLGVQPMHVAAFAAAAGAVLAGAVAMTDAYRAIEWRTVLVVAALLPLGVAMQESGAAAWLAEQVAAAVGPLGPYWVLAGLALLSSLLSQALDGPPAVVLLAPVAAHTATALAIDQRPLLMAIALAASAAFMTPFSHKANLLVMSLGGYRSRDFLRVGTPLTLIVLVAIVALVPLVFPF